MGVIFLERRNSNNNSIRRSIDFAIVKTLFWCDDVSFPNNDISSMHVSLFKSEVENVFSDFGKVPNGVSSE